MTIFIIIAILGSLILLMAIALICYKIWQNNRYLHRYFSERDSYLNLTDKHK